MSAGLEEPVPVGIGCCVKVLPVLLSVFIIFIVRWVIWIIGKGLVSASESVHGFPFVIEALGPPAFGFWDRVL